MRAILVNPYDRTVTKIEHDGTLEEMYRTIGCETDCVVRLHDHDDLWLNDVGLLTAGLPVFRLAGYAHPLAGRGLILGHDDEGESDPAQIPLQQITAIVRWTDDETTGSLEPTREELLPNGAFVIKTGSGILRARQNSEAR